MSSLPQFAGHSLLGRTHLHHDELHPGEHVLVKGYGGATVVECGHADQFSGRVEVKYDKDGSTYHCYTSKLFPQPVPPKAPASAENVFPSPGQVHHLHHSDLHPGKHVFVTGVGGATVVECGHKDQYGDRVEVRFDDDGSTYHCYTSKLYPDSQRWETAHEVHTSNVEQDGRAEQGAVSQVQVKEEAGAAPAEKHKGHEHLDHRDIRAGEHVIVKGFGGATVVACSHKDKYGDKVEVQYDEDGSTYHCDLSMLHPDPHHDSKKHHVFQVGDHVTVAGFGEGTVVEPLQQDGMFAGRYAVRYDDDETIYHCYPSKLHLSPQTVRAPAAAEVVCCGSQEPFHIGSRVLVKGYGEGTVDAHMIQGRYHGRVRVRYPDGSSYHCHRSQLALLSGAPKVESAAGGDVPVETAPQPDGPPTEGDGQSRYRIGEEVLVKGFGLAVVNSVPQEGKYGGRVQVRYDDGSTFHCLMHELAPRGSAEYNQAVDTMQRATLNLGDKVAIQGFGVAVVDDLPYMGRYAGRVRVRYPDGSTYHCHRGQVAPWPFRA